MWGGLAGVGGVEAGEFAEGVAQARGVGGAWPERTGKTAMPPAGGAFDFADQAAVFGLPAGNLGVTEGNPRGTGETVMGLSGNYKTKTTCPHHFKKYSGGKTNTATAMVIAT